MLARPSTTSAVGCTTTVDGAARDHGRFGDSRPRRAHEQPNRARPTRSRVRSALRGQGQEPVLRTVRRLLAAPVPPGCRTDAGARSSPRRANPHAGGARRDGRVWAMSDHRRPGAPEQPFANFQYEIYARRPCGRGPGAAGVAASDAGAARAQLLSAGGVRLCRRRRRLGADDGRQPARPSSTGRSSRGCCATSRSAICRRRARHRAGGPRDAGARWASSRSSTREAELAVARAAAAQGIASILSTAASHTIEDVAEASGFAPLVSALLAGASASWRRASSPAPCARRLRSDRADARHLDARLAPPRPAERLPAVPERRGGRQLLLRPRLPRGARAPPEEHMEPAIGHWAYQFSNPSVTWEDLAVAARADRPADRAEGHPPPRRRRPRRPGRGRRA